MLQDNVTHRAIAATITDPVTVASASHVLPTNLDRFYGVATSPAVLPAVRGRFLLRGQRQGAMLQRRGDGRRRLWMSLMPVVDTETWIDFRQILAYVQRRVGDHATAEDILQEVFLRVATRPESWERVTSPRHACGTSRNTRSPITIAEGAGKPRPPMTYSLRPPRRGRQ